MSQDHQTTESDIPVLKISRNSKAEVSQVNEQNDCTNPRDLVWYDTAYSRVKSDEHLPSSDSCMKTLKTPLAKAMAAST